MIRRSRKLFKIMGFTIFLILLLLYQNINVQAEEEMKNVLIINSYHQGFAWTREQTEGIMNQLQQEGFNYSFYVEYMDWKNYNSEENLDYLTDYYRYKYNKKRIDIIVTTDDVALQFALENREKLFSDAPVVFSGVNTEGVKSITNNYSRVTGVVEVVDPTQTLVIAKRINPSIKKIYLLNDNSESGKSTMSIIVNTVSEFDSNLEEASWNDLPFEEIVKRAGELEKDSIILIGTYFRDIDDRLMDQSYVTKVISENSCVPVYHIYDFGLGYGVIGGSLLSGKMQGESAAKMAYRILNGEDPDKIPIAYTDSTRTVFDYNQLLRFDVSPSVLPKDSEIVNKPFSFYETYKTLVLGVVAAFTALITFLSILIFYIRKINKMKINLQENHEELSMLYEELTASDEEIKEQYGEMLRINEKIKLSEEKLANLAYYDPLTGLLNKHSLYERSVLTFAEGRKAALLFIDIDNFKYVNDTLGHAFGDKLIVKISERLTTLLWEGSTLYRLSGDEFILIVDQLDKQEQAEEYASYLLNNFRKDFDSLNSNLHISLSIGIAMSPDHGRDLEQLLKNADIAMYKAKEAGRKSYVVYDQGMNEVLTERIRIEKNLQSAMDNNEFELYYQPQWDIKTNKITGFEALLRWNSPVLGPISPLKFIKVAEDTHFIIPLGTWVLNSACAFLKRLETYGYQDLSISVNISILQLLQSDFLTVIEDALSINQLEAEKLELEITETILMESFDRIISRLKKLRDKKVKIALDDFGKGYSSLNYLKQLPITTMKVDKSFIDYITDSGTDDLVGHIISLGKVMGMCVVAEGVEEQCQLDYLIQHECDKIQGFLFSKPQPEKEILRLLKEKE
ncbi:MAG: diguanylate cyclase protein [Firmicutes bacterium]|nr:diguanylate cyclase protein [Bacillota bacterium]